MTAVHKGTRTHISLNVSSVERSVRFYEAFFGVPVHKRRPDYANFQIDDPPLKFALQEQPPSAGVGPLSHLGIEVNSRAHVQAARDRLVGSGLAKIDEKDTSCCYAVQDKVWAHVPDGNGWEVYVLLDELLDEQDWRDHQAQRDCASACCTAELK